ncbi:MAG TPA: heme-binding protein [Chthoniobacteraceae bacterium]
MASLLSLTPASAAEQLTADEVELVLAQAVTEASRVNRRAVIAVVDREGFVLGAWKVSDSTSAIRKGVLAAAVSRAGTAAFLSSDENAFTSRTAGYIIQQHFPVGVRNTPPGPLVGVGFSNLFYSDINRFKQFPAGFDPFFLNSPTQSPGTRGLPVPLTSLNDSPGGVPLYKGGHLVGGIGVTGDGSPTDLSPAASIFAGFTRRSVTAGFKSGQDTDEDVALAGQSGFRPPDEILASNVLINGIRIPYVHPSPEDIRDVQDVQSLGTIGSAAPGFPVQASPAAFPFPIARLGGIEGEIRQPIRADPLPGKIGRAGRLTAREVEEIISLAAERCAITRAGIRLPLGTRAKVFISVVNNPHRNEVAPAVLGTFRVEDATMFSWDVSVQKARTAVFFSNKQLAQSCRTVGFLAQRYIPPGLDGRPYGPYFGFQEAVSLKTHPRTGTFPGNPNLPNGITIFPGGFPLYRDGELIGAIGISGDGVDQDDLIAASGSIDFLPNPRIRADSYTYRGARLPYAKFPRDPEQ